MSVIPNVDDYGINLIELRDRAIAEGKLDHAAVFTRAIEEAVAGDKAWYEKICKEIAFMVSNTGMDALRIDPNYIQKEVCLKEETPLN